MPTHSPWYHWSDIDYGGFVMLSRLRHAIGPAVIPYRMGIHELQQYAHLTQAINAAYAEKLNKLKSHAGLEDCNDCIDFMTEKRVKLEQEAMLAEVLPGKG
jgi:hypothetical protein